MVTIVFFAFIGFGVLAAIFISMQASGRRNGKQGSAAPAENSAPKVARATSDKS